MHFCYGYVYFFPESNFIRSKAIGVFDNSVFINYDCCRGKRTDSIKFIDEGYRIYYDSTDQGYYIYTNCGYCGVCCGTMPSCRNSIYIHKNFRNNLFQLQGKYGAYFPLEDQVNYPPPVFKRIRLIADTVIRKSGVAYHNELCGKFQVKVMAQWKNKLWVAKGNLEDFKKEIINHKDLDIKEGKMVNWNSKHINTSRLYIIDDTNFTKVIPSKKKLIVVDKHANEAGIYFNEYNGFFLLKKRWFHRFKGRVIEDYQNEIAVKRGKHLFFQDDYLVKIRENKRRIKYRMKQLKLSSVPK